MTLDRLGPVLSEPVRGSLPEPSFLSLSGLEQVRAFSQHRVARAPHAHLFGYRLTQVSSGTVVVNQPISPWFEINEGFVDLLPTAELTIFVTANTVAPPGTHIRTVNMSLRYLRPCTVDNESVIARGRVLHTGSSFTTVEVLIEDGLGRAVAHATGSVVATAMEPPPPPLPHPLEFVEEAMYPTVDPPLRPVPAPANPDSERLGPRERAFAGIKDRSVLPPLFRFLDARVLDVSEGYAKTSLSASEWFCRINREVAEGIVGLAGNFAAGMATVAAAESGQRMVIINATSSFMTPVVPDGRAVEAVATLHGERDGVLVVNVEVTDADGRTVLMGQGTSLLSNRLARSGRRAPERVLLTVLFTDVVGSTERVTELGDKQWRELLDDHHAVVRRALELNKGREVNTAGDGFLATFDSPTRAVQGAQAIRDGVERLGLQIRAGIHTGECELLGRDITGLAVHVASRVQSVAEPGEIVVSATVRDLAAGSGLSWYDRGEHELKGVQGRWHLYALSERP